MNNVRNYYTIKNFLLLEQHENRISQLLNIYKSSQRARNTTSGEDPQRLLSIKSQKYQILFELLVLIDPVTISNSEGQFFILIVEIVPVETWYQCLKSWRQQKHDKHEWGPSVSKNDIDSETALTQGTHDVQYD